MSFKSESNEKLKEIGNNPDTYSLVGDTSRLGVRLFAVMLEYGHFNPRTPRNDLFDLRLIKFPEEEPSLYWYAITIPVEDKEFAVKICKETGLVISDGVPIIISFKGEEVFPLNGPSVFTLTSNSKSLIYNNNSKELQKLIEAEDKEIERIFSEDDEQYRQELLDQGISKNRVDAIIKEHISRRTR